MTVRTFADHHRAYLIACAVLLCQQPTAFAEIASTPLSIRVVNGWKVVESPNFRCRSVLADGDAIRLAESCEAWRSRLRKAWISNASEAAWTPKCEVVVHSDRTAYNIALSRPGDASVGSTMMNFDQGRTVMRRIDVRADASDWSNAALPHELTHVVLGERFGGHALPRWADEGIAMLSESPEKHRERLTNLRDLLSRRQTMSLSELVHATRLPSPQMRNAFYGQSIALTSILIRKSTPAQFADFIEMSQRVGFEKALQDHYQINGMSSLQKQWDEWATRPDATGFVSLQLHEGLTPILAKTSGGSVTVVVD